MGDTFAGGEGFFDSTHDCVGGLDPRSLGHPDIDHELVALGRREELLRHECEEHDSEGERSTPRG